MQKTYDEIYKNERRALSYMTEDAEIVLTAYGTPARIVKSAVNELRRQGVKAGCIRPITLYPFPDDAYAACAARDCTKAFLSVELSLGQMVEDVKLAVAGKKPVYFYGRTGGNVPDEEEIVRAALESLKKSGGELMKVFQKTKMLTDAHLHYCPGCTHGIVHRLVAESIEELGVQDKCIGIAPVGCAVFAYDYFNCDMQEAAHGRAPAVATGIKRTHPDKIVFVYQGDGDLASIGMAETVHAAARGEKISIIFINNSIYGMTGGQMAPTTLIGQKATTCQNGRDPAVNGYPIRVCELLATLDAPYYIERVSTHDVKHVLAAKKAIKKAIQFQAEDRGYSFVEVLVSCPTNWHMRPVDALRFMGEECTKTFPLGVYRDKSQG